MLVTFIDYVIEYFKSNKLLLKVINKNFSTGMYSNEKYRGEEIESILKVFKENLEERGYTKSEARLTLYMIIELLGSVCYNAIVLSEPCDIEKIKPVLLKNIKNMVK